MVDIDRNQKPGIVGEGAPLPYYFFLIFLIFLYTYNII